jgi:dTDP-glucose 4,6-dehydratase
LIFVTGGSGFIGSAFILDWLEKKQEKLLNIDKLTYASNSSNLLKAQSNERYLFSQTDICNYENIIMLFEKHKPSAIYHFAAESHVDRSIQYPLEFVQTNVVGTFTLLTAAKTYWNSLPEQEKNVFRFIHVSTDEVYGSLGFSDEAFVETSQYQPNSPYSASKASSDHFARAFFHTYGLPVLTTNCSNNYGPRQNKEKLIPTVIGKALRLEPIPVYGKGINIRDWLYVHDHCDAIRTVAERGTIGEVYNVGGDKEMNNLEIVHVICSLLDELVPRESGQKYHDLISFVTDRPGHDLRYAVNFEKLRSTLGWSPATEFKDGLKKTILWYLDNQQYL